MIKYNVTHVIDFEMISNFQQFGLVIFVITVMAEILYAFIVYFTTNKKMQIFRVLTFIYIFECTFAEFIVYCLKPIRIFPYKIIFPVGFLAPMSAELSAALCVSTFWIYGLIVDTIAIILIERHFLIVSIGKQKLKKFRFFVYFSMAATFIFLTISCTLITYSNLNTQSAKILLESEVRNAEIILIFQSSLFMLNYENIEIFVAAVFFSFFLYASLRVGIATFILRENYKFAKNSKSNFSEKTRNQFSLMFQSTMTQCVTTLIFNGFGALYILANFFTIEDAKTKFILQIFYGIFIAYPIADVIIVITVVKGYRNTFKKMLKTLLNCQIQNNHGARLPSANRVNTPVT